jgi:hypothetical protein
MTSKLWQKLPWGDSMRWSELAVINVLEPGEMIPGIGSKDMMVE